MRLCYPETSGQTLGTAGNKGRAASDSVFCEIRMIRFVIYKVFLFFVTSCLRGELVRIVVSSCRCGEILGDFVLDIKLRRRSVFPFF